IVARIGSFLPGSCSPTEPGTSGRVMSPGTALIVSSRAGASTPRGIAQASSAQCSCRLPSPFRPSAVPRLQKPACRARLRRESITTRQATGPRMRGHPPFSGGAEDPPNGGRTPTGSLSPIPVLCTIAPIPSRPVRTHFPLPLEILLARAAGNLSRLARTGGGTTVPGKLLWKLDPRAVDELARRLPLGSALVSATNGKTTTAAMAARILRGKVTLAHNSSGANLVSGVASTLLAARDAQLGLFEVDEAALPEVVARVRPRAVCLGNLFRDQLDRYGELEHVAERWRGAVRGLDPAAALVVNGDDPQVGDLARERSGAVVFGIDDPRHARATLQHAADSKYCVRCGTPYAYTAAYVGHLGDYRCPKCGHTRPALTIRATDVELRGPTAAAFLLGTPEGRRKVQLRVPGLYNVYKALVAEDLVRKRDGVLAAAGEGTAVLAVCGGYQLLGRSYRDFDGFDLPGIGLFPLETVAGERRMIGDVLLECELERGARRTLAGFENHAGRTRLDPGVEPLGRVIAGFGNDGESGYEGCRIGRAVGTYLHGPLLPRNPWFADWVLAQALAHAMGEAPELAPLPDDLEQEAHAVSARRAHARGGRD